MARNNRDSRRAVLAATERHDSADAFLRDPDGSDGAGRGMKTRDDLAELLAEDFVVAATTNADADGDEHEEVVPEELGGPFEETAASDEFAGGTDESNPEDATSEPLPRAMGDGVPAPVD